MLEEIEADKALSIFTQLKSQRITHTWRGYGSVIFLELGTLDEEKKGEYTISTAQGWELLDLSGATLVNYENNFNKLDKEIAQLKNQKFHEIVLKKGKIQLFFDSVILQITLDTPDEVLSLHIKKSKFYLTLKQNKFLIDKGGG